MGITTKVNKVEDNIPPMTAMANGPFCSAPAPNPNAAGSSARISVNDVIRTGRNRVGHASTSASSIAFHFSTS